MPFTPAHPAAILPLVHLPRKWFIPSALVIGSISPDFAYFLPLGMNHADSHCVEALVWFCLPVGLAAYLIFHVILKHPLLSLMPAFLSRRLACVGSDAGLANVPWLAVLFSLLVGALTHLVWDAFTHDGAPGVGAIPFLRVEIFSVGTYSIYAYRLLQYFSSAIGMSILGIWIFRWLRTTRVGPEPAIRLTAPTRLAVFAGLFGIPAICGLASLFGDLSFPITIRSLELAVGEGVVIVFDSFGIVLLVHSLWWHLWLARKN